MKVEVVVRFKDLTADGVIREPGTVLEVPEWRAEKLLAMGLVKVIPQDSSAEERQEAAEAEPVKKTARKKKTEAQ